MKIKTLVMGTALALMATGAIAADLVKYEQAPGLPGVIVGKYVGVTGGAVTKGHGKTKAAVGAVAGLQLDKNLAIEGQYEYKDSADHLLTGNVLLGTETHGIYPYVVGGVGYRWTEDKNDGAYVVGAGVKKSLSEDLDADLRYRYVGSFSGGPSGESRFTVGLNLKF